MQREVWPDSGASVAEDQLRSDPLPLEFRFCVVDLVELLEDLARSFVTDHLLQERTVVEEQVATSGDR